MAQVDADDYIRLTGPDPVYGQSDGLYYKRATGEVVVIVNGTEVLNLGSSGIEGADLAISGQVQGDLMRRGASAWERFAAKTSGQLVIGNGTDVTSVAVTGDVTISSAGVTAIGATKVTAAMLGANLGKGFIPLEIGAARIIAANAIGNLSEGMLLDGNSDPSLARVNAATDKALRIIWGAASVVEVQFPPFVYPPDLDDTAAVTVNIIAAMSAANDTPTIAVSYWEGLGDTNAGGNTGAVTGTSLAQYSVSIAAGDVGAYPKVGNISLIPAAHATDALHLYGAWLEYTRKT